METDQEAAGADGTTTGKFDPGAAHPARVYNYWLGGKDHYLADRNAARQVMNSRPEVVAGARANRAFLARVVRYLAADCGIRQFLDIGTGLPAPGATHQIAQDVDPASVVAYADNDPLVLAHARALLTCAPPGRCGYIEADPRTTTPPATIPKPSPTTTPAGRSATTTANGPPGAPPSPSTLPPQPAYGRPSSKPSPATPRPSPRGAAVTSGSYAPAGARTRGRVCREWSHHDVLLSWMFQPRHTGRARSAAPLRCWPVSWLANEGR